MLPMKAHMSELLEGIHTQNMDMINEFKNNELWRTLEQLMGWVIADGKYLSFEYIFYL